MDLVAYLFLVLFENICSELSIKNISRLIRFPTHFFMKSAAGSTSGNKRDVQGKKRTKLNLIVQHMQIKYLIKLYLGSTPRAWLELLEINMHQTWR